MSLPRYPEYKPSGVEWIGDIPSHWAVTPISVLATLNDETLQESTDPELEIEYVDIGSVSLTRGIERSEPMTFSNAPSRARRIVRDGDVLVSTVRTYLKAIAPVALPAPNLIASTGFAVVRPKSGQYSGYLKYGLQCEAFVHQVIARSTGVSYPAINASDLARIPLWTPSFGEQYAIASFLDRETAKIDALIAEQEKLLALLAEKRQATISHAVTRGLDPNAPMKDSGIPWLGEVPAHWQVRRLRFVADIETGSADTANSMEDGEYPFFVRSQTVERIDHFTHDCEAVLTAGDGAGVGKVFHHFIGKFCAHQRVYIFRNFRAVTGAFFFEYLKALFYRVVLEGTAKSTVDSLRRPMIADFPIVVPDPKEMPEIEKRIQMESSRFDQLVSEAEATIFLLKERRSALIAAAVTGQIDVRGLVEAQAT